MDVFCKHEKDYMKSRSIEGFYRISHSFNLLEEDERWEIVSETAKSVLSG